MSCYDSLAVLYDRLTLDVDYGEFADRYEEAFREDGGEFHLLLDLCCGTGSLSREMTLRGYEMISVDSSEQMLMEAREKCSALPVPPLFLQQDVTELDLYGTVDAAFCSLEGINYLSWSDVSELLRRLKNFIRPGGLFLFAIRSAEFLASLDGDTFVDEDDDFLCLWRADYDETLPALVYGMDIFSRVGEFWERSREEHIEYAHQEKQLATLLTGNGFSWPEIIHESDRLHFASRRL